MIILIGHLGIQAPNKDWQSYAIRDNMPDIGLIIDSHSHDNLDKYEQREEKTLIASARVYDQNLGIVDIKVKVSYQHILRQILFGQSRLERYWSMIV